MMAQYTCLTESSPLETNIGFYENLHVYTDDLPEVILKHIIFKIKVSNDTRLVQSRHQSAL